MNIDSEYLAKLSTILFIVNIAGATRAVVAGGAIRDMLFDKPISDIDVFYEGDINSTWLNKETFTCKEVNFPPYVNTNALLTHEVSYKALPVKIQLIKCYVPIDDVIKEFPTCVSRVYYEEFKGLQNLSEEVILTENDKIIDFDHPTTSKYYNKIKSKYSDYTLNFLNVDHIPSDLEEPF